MARPKKTAVAPAAKKPAVAKPAVAKPAVAKPSSRAALKRTSTNAKAPAVEVQHPAAKGRAVKKAPVPEKTPAAKTAAGIKKTGPVAKRAAASKVAEAVPKKTVAKRGAKKAAAPAVAKKTAKAQVAKAAPAPKKVGRPRKSAPAPVEKPKAGKRKRNDEDETEEVAAIPVKKQKTAAKPVVKPVAQPKTAAKPGRGRPRKDAAAKPAPKKAAAKPKAVAKPKVVKEAKPKAVKPKVIINTAPTDRLDIFVTGINEGGELGLGDATKKATIARATLNPKLKANEDQAVVQIVAGGMHGAALTHDNKILTWGINDNSALGREAKDTRKEKDLDEVEQDDNASIDSDYEHDVSMAEATPTEINMDGVPKGTVFTQIVAADSATFALTDEGLVYGCGLARGNDGELGFAPGVAKQLFFTLVPDLVKIVKLAVGNNHFLALTKDNKVFAWGAGDQNQLGRQLVARHKTNSLRPTMFGMKNAVDIFACPDHSFAINKKGDVYSWGANNYGQCGQTENAGDNSAVTPTATLVKTLRGKKIKSLTGGTGHSVAVTEAGEVLIWGRVDAFALGLDVNILPDDDFVLNEAGHKAVLKIPTAVPGLKAKMVAASNDHNIAITEDGKAWSWGFNGYHQCGQPIDEDEPDDRVKDNVRRPTLVSNKNVDGKKLISADCGGQFSYIIGAHTKEGSGSD